MRKIFSIIIFFLCFSLSTQMIFCQEKREDEELFPKEDLNLLNPLPTISAPETTGYEAYKVWAGERMNNYGEVKLDLGELPKGSSSGSNGSEYSSKNGKTNTIADDIESVNKRADQLNTTKFSIKNSEISPRYPRTFKGLDNEALYAMAEEEKKEKLIKYGAGALLIFLLIYLFFKYFSDKFSFANKSTPNEIVKTPAPVVEIDDTLNRLQKIQHLKDNGTLTEVEFDIIKKRIINS